MPTCIHIHLVHIIPLYIHISGSLVKYRYIMVVDTTEEPHCKKSFLLLLKIVELQVNFISYFSLFIWTCSISNQCECSLEIRIILLYLTEYSEFSILTAEGFSLLLILLNKSSTAVYSYRWGHFVISVFSV